MPKLIRITTVPMALRYLLPGQLQYMRQNGYDVMMVSADGPERADVITAEGCPHIIIPMTRKITPFKDLYCLWKLIRLFKKERPDIVHTHTPKAGLLGMLAAKLAGVPVRIHTVAGMPLMVATGAKYQLLKQMEKLTYWAAKQVWPNSTSLYNFILQHQLAPKKKVQVIAKGSSNGIDLARFSKAALQPNTGQQIKQQVHYNPAYTYLLSVGRLVQDKGITELVASFIQLHHQNTNLRLILVGQYEQDLDPLPAETLQHIQQHPAIITTGWDSRVEYYMSFANLFVFPSHREGFPNVLLQAGAMGCPIVCSTISGNVDIVDHNETGLLFATNNANSLLEQVQYALQQSEKMQQMAANLLQKIQQYYQREKLWAAIQAEYVILLQQYESQ